MATLSRNPQGKTLAALESTEFDVKFTSSAEQGSRRDARLLVEAAGAFSITVEEQAPEGTAWIPVSDPSLPFTGADNGSIALVLFGDSTVRLTNSGAGSAKVWIN